jgi:hypothetical protein
MLVAGKLSPKSIKYIESNRYADNVTGISIWSKEEGEEDGAYYDKGLAGLRYSADLLELVGLESGEELNKLLDDILDEEKEIIDQGFKMSIEQSRKALSLIKSFKDLRLSLQSVINEDNLIFPDKVDIVKEKAPHLLYQSEDGEGKPKYWIEHPLWYAETAILLLEVAVDSNLEIWFE